MELMTDSIAWPDLYSAALFEGDDSLIIFDRIDAAERAIAARARELFSSAGDHVDELHALDSARYALRALRGAVRLRNSGGAGPGLISLPTWP